MQTDVPHIWSIKIRIRLLINVPLAIWLISIESVFKLSKMLININSWLLPFVKMGILILLLVLILK